MRLLDVFLLHCLLAASPPDSPDEIAAMARNQHLVAERGRDPALRLQRGGDALAPADWGAALLDEFAPVAAALDEAHGGEWYRRAVTAARDALRDPSTLPSARVLRETEERHAKSFPAFALARSLEHQRTLLELPLPDDVAERFAAMAAESVAAQRRMEAADTVPFESFRQQYLAQDLMSGPHFRAPG